MTTETTHFHKYKTLQVVKLPRVLVHEFLFWKEYEPMNRVLLRCEECGWYAQQDISGVFDFQELQKEVGL